MGLSDDGVGTPDALFYEAPRVCERCDAQVSRPDRVSWGADAAEWHICPDGEPGLLRLLYPPAGREKRDAAVVDFDPDKLEPR